MDEPASVSRLIYHISILSGAIYVGYYGSRELLIEKRFSVEFLMAVAAIGAALLDFLLEGAVILFLYSLAEYFEDYIEDRAKKTIKTLSSYIPEEAAVLEAGHQRIASPKEVEPGAIIVIRPGERVPLDGIVTSGLSDVDQSRVTGESLPIAKAKGDAAYAGTLNNSGLLRVLVTGKTEETLVSRIAKLVGQSRKRKAKIEKLVDRFARIYVPLVIGTALFTALIMPNIAGGAASDVGIAMSGGGVAAALESADVILVKDELKRILYVHELSTMTLKIARQNIAISLAAKLALGGLGFLGLVPLWFTVALGDDGVTLLRLINTLRLTRPGAA